MVLGIEILSGIIHEVAPERVVPENLAVQKFFQDIEKNYDNKLGYESTLGHLRSEITNMNKELNTTRSALETQLMAKTLITENIPYKDCY